MFDLNKHLPLNLNIAMKTKSLKYYLNKKLCKVNNSFD